MRFVVVVLFALTSSMAEACSRGLAISFEDKLNAELNYLICLHNEQAVTLDRYAGAINAQSQQISDLESQLTSLRRRVKELEGQ